MEDPSTSPFKLSHIRMMMHLPPCYNGNIEVGVDHMLSHYIMKYLDELDGVVLTITELKILSEKGRIIGDAPMIHFPISFNFLLFAPTVGSPLVGKVNKIGGDHIGLLVFGVFNASIPLQFISKEDAQEDCWRSSKDSDKIITTGGYLEFIVVSITKVMDMISITGAMKDALDENEDLPLLSNLHKKKRKAQELEEADEEPAEAARGGAILEKESESKKKKKKSKSKAESPSVVKTSSDQKAKDTPKKDTPKKDTPKKDTTKKETPKKDTSKKETPKKDTSKKETPKKETPKKDAEAKKITPKKETPAKNTESVKKETPKKQDTVTPTKQEATPIKKETPTPTPSKKDATPMKIVQLNETDKQVKNEKKEKKHKKEKKNKKDKKDKKAKKMKLSDE